jgi:hypothetical protein
MERKRRVISLYLHINVQDTDLPLSVDSPDSLDRRSIVVVRELGPFDKLLLVNTGLERFSVHKVVMNAILLAITRLTSRV